MPELPTHDPKDKGPRVLDPIVLVLSACQSTLDTLLYHLIVELGYPLRAATIHVAWRASAYSQTSLPAIALFEGPEYMLRVLYYTVTTSSQKWADTSKPEYAGRYYFEVLGLSGTFYCPSFADVALPAPSYPGPEGLGINFSENIQQALKGKSGEAVDDFKHALVSSFQYFIV